MIGIEQERAAYARLMADRFNQPVNSPNQAVQINNLSFIGQFLAPTYEPPLLQNHDGTWEAQPLYDR